MTKITRQSNDNSRAQQNVGLLLAAGALLYFAGERHIVALPQPDCNIVQNIVGVANSSQSIVSTPAPVIKEEAPSTPSQKKDHSSLMMLRHNVTTQSIASLKAKMDLFYTDLNKQVKGTKNAQARRLLSAMVEEQMVPTLPKVSISKNLTAEQLKKSKAQEREDVFIYKRFFNEETKKCHQFGTHMFESGALDGLQYSNTFMLEEYYEEPTILVEASPENWDKLKVNAPEFRPRAQIHNAALCPLGTKSVCMQGQNSNAMHKVNKDAAGACPNATACFDFDESIHFSLFSLDIEGFELEFLRMRRPNADVLMIEVIQWARKASELPTVIQLVAYMADIGYYLYEETIGFRNFLFLSQDLVNDCSDTMGWEK